MKIGSRFWNSCWMWVLAMGVVLGMWGQVVAQEAARGDNPLSAEGAVSSSGKVAGEDEPSSGDEKRDPFLKNARGERAESGGGEDYGKRDPYAEVAAEAAAAAREPAKVIAVSSEFIEVPRERWLEVMAADEGDPLDGGALREEVQGWLEAGDARHVGGGMTVTRSGQRAKVQSVQEFIYPTDLTSGGPNARFPSAFETWNLGFELEVDPQIAPSEDEGKRGVPKIDMNLVPAMVWYVGEYRYGYEEGALAGEPLVIEPIYRSMQSTTSQAVRSGEYRLLDSFSWTDEVGGPTREGKVLSFVRADVVEVAPVPGNEKMPDGAQGILQIEWIEVSSAWWSDWLLGSEGSALLLDARRAVGEALKDGSAELVEVVRMPVRSGQRVKSESTRFMLYPAEWDPPREEGERSERASCETRNLGVTVEVDPVLASGGFADVNFVPEIVTHVGENIHQRIEIGGNWVPDVTTPLFYTMKNTAAVTVALNEPMLVSVMAPADEEGFPDGERRTLLFLTVRR
ncbi:MAG: hypothetical protein AAF591_05640 [Verrucomicrobiota bacterium]